MASILDLVKQSSIIVLAVKPQSSRQVLEAMKGHIQNHLLISIMAGISISNIDPLKSAERDRPGSPPTRQYDI